VVLGKKSGIPSIRIKCAELGIDVAEDAQSELLARVKELGARERRPLTDDEFRALVPGAAG
jgi:isopropylmalate/homocitrate/citramalate synthase